MNIARALGVKAVIFHTNHIPNFRLDSYRKNCLDFAHAFLSHTSLEEWGTSLKPYVTHLHLNDNNKDMDTHYPIGTGALPWDVYRNFLADIPVEKRPSVLIEVRGYDDLAASVRYLEQEHLYPFS